MPQCSKCGREISDYGLCSRCAALSKKKVLSTSNKPICPVCTSRLNQAVGVGKYRCCDCDAVFYNDGQKEDK